MHKSGKEEKFHENIEIDILNGVHASHELFTALTVQFGFHVPLKTQM